MRNDVSMSLCAVFVMLMSVLTATATSATVYDLAADWSDASNPNGPWSYDAAPGVPLTAHTNDWDPGTWFTSPQPAWSFATRPDYGHIPFFLKVVTTSMFSADAPIGRVLMHNNDGANSPCGLENLPAGVSWTAPEAGPVAISGGMWQVVDFGRTEEWTVSLNGVAISGGLLSYSPLITSESPLDLSSGTGGAAVLHQTVAIGDVIALYFTRPDGQPYGHTIGVDLTISVVPEPTTVELIALGAGSFAVIYPRRVCRKVRNDVHI